MSSHPQKDKRRGRRKGARTLKESSKKSTLKESSKKSTLKESSKKSTLKGSSKKSTLKESSKKSTLKESSKKSTLNGPSKKSTNESTTPDSSGVVDFQTSEGLATFLRDHPLFNERRKIVTPSLRGDGKTCRSIRFLPFDEHHLLAPKRPCARTCLHMRACANRCGKDSQETRLYRCSKCRVTWYCSRECQEEHWVQHKTICAESPYDGKLKSPVREAISQEIMAWHPFLPATKPYRNGFWVMDMDGNMMPRYAVGDRAARSLLSPKALHWVQSGLSLIMFISLERNGIYFICCSLVGDDSELVGPFASPDIEL